MNLNPFNCDPDIQSDRHTLSKSVKQTERQAGGQVDEPICAQIGRCLVYSVDMVVAGHYVRKKWRDEKLAFEMKIKNEKKIM